MSERVRVSSHLESRSGHEPWKAEGACDRSWMDQAACKGQPVDLFIGTKNMRPARSFCEECPVREECLEYALADADLQGMWGNTVEDERDRIRRERRGTPTSRQVENLVADGEWHELWWVISAQDADRAARKRRASWIRNRVADGDLEERTWPDGTRVVRMSPARAREAA